MIQKILKLKNDGNMIYSLKGKAKIPNQKFVVKGDRSIYNKLISELVIVGNVEFFDNLNDIYIKVKKLFIMR